MAMTMDRARELFQVQVKFGGCYNRNSTRMISVDVQLKHSIPASDMLIAESDL